MALRFKKTIMMILTLSSSVFTTSCTKKNPEATQTSAAAASELNLAIWNNYLAPETAKKFTEQTGIKINISNYSSNEDLLAKVQVGGSGIDVAVPSDYMVEILAKQGLLLELKKSLIPNFSNISSELLSLNYDDGNKFSAPYSWTTSGIAVNRDLYKGKIESWKDVLENPQLKGKISLLDDVRETTALALKHDGVSLNSTDEKELKAAKTYLLKIKGNVKMFQSDSIDLLLNKEVVVAHAYSSDALKAWNQSNGKIEYILPKEGGSRAVDNLVVMRAAKNIDAAHKFINFLLSEESNVAFVSTMFGGPVLTSTRAKLEDRLKNNTALFPSQDAIQKLETIRDLGDKTALYDDLWLAVKTTN